MKKKFLVLLVTFLFTGTIFAQATVDLSTAIDKSTKDIAATLSGRPRIAVVTFYSDSKNFSEYLAQEVQKSLMGRGTLQVRDRNTSLIDAEIDYQYLSGAVSDSSMVNIGERLGAQYLVYGTFDQFGGNMQFTIQVTNVETAEISYMASYGIKKNSKITELLGEDMELTSAEDYLQAIGRCQKKLNDVEREKLKNIQNTGAKISAKYQTEINEVKRQEKEPWESTQEYNDRIAKGVKELENKRDTELNGIEKTASINYDNQSKQIEIYKDKLVKDLQNTTFELKGDAVQVWLGEFNAESKPKKWPLSIKSRDKNVAYTYTGNYFVNDADVKTEYKTVEAARAANNFEGEISYRINEGSSKNTFDVYIVSVKLYIKSPFQTIVNESVNEVKGHLDANRTLNGTMSYTSVKETKTTEPVNDKKTKGTSYLDSYESQGTDNVTKTDVERGTSKVEKTPVNNAFLFEDFNNWSVNKDKGTMVIRNQEMLNEGINYKTLTIAGDTNGASFWECNCYDSLKMQAFVNKGNTIKFKCIGDGKRWLLSFRLYAEYPNNTDYQYYFSTKKGKVVEVEIPYSKLQYATWSKSQKFDKSQINSVLIGAADISGSQSRSIQIFDVRVY